MLAWQPDDHIAEDELQTHLGVIAENRLFRNSEKLRRLLTYLVEAQRAGDEAKLKGYTIGVEALDRPDDFDPQLDPIVRVQAKRLRDALEQFYATDGRDLPIRIVIEKGSYRPTIRRIAPPEPGPAGSGALTALLNTSGGDFAAGRRAPGKRPPIGRQETTSPAPARRRRQTFILSMLLLGLAGLAVAGSPIFQPQSVKVEPRRQVAVVTPEAGAVPAKRKGRFNSAAEKPSVRVISHEAALRERGDVAFVSTNLVRFGVLNVLNGREAGDTHGAVMQQDQYLITIQGCPGCERDVVSATVIFVPRNEIVYASTFPIDKGGRSLALIKLIRTVASLDGPIFSHYLKRMDISTPVLTCYAEALEFAKTFAPEIKERIQKCVAEYESTNESDPLMDQLTAFASVMAYWHLEDVQNNLIRAQRASRKAIELDPQMPIGYFVRALVYESMGNPQFALMMAQRAYELNPLDNVLAFGLANSLLSNNEFGQAREILERVRTESMVTPVWIAVKLALVYLLENDIAAMHAISSDIQGTFTPVGRIMVLIAMAKTANNEQVMSAYQDLRTAYPLLLRINVARLMIETHFRNRNISTRIITELEAAIARAEAIASLGVKE